MCYVSFDWARSHSQGNDFNDSNLCQWCVSTWNRWVSMSLYECNIRPSKRIEWHLIILQKFYFIFDTFRWKIYSLVYSFENYFFNLFRILPQRITLTNAPAYITTIRIFVSQAVNHWLEIQNKHFFCTFWDSIHSKQNIFKHLLHIGMKLRFPFFFSINVLSMKRKTWLSLCQQLNVIL